MADRLATQNLITGENRFYHTLNSDARRGVDQNDKIDSLLTKSG